MQAIAKRRVRFQHQYRTFAFALNRSSLRTPGVSHARFPAFARGQPLLVSGGNDGQILLWDWTAVSDALAGRRGETTTKTKASPSGAEVGMGAAARVIAEAAHGRKVRMRLARCRLNAAILLPGLFRRSPLP